MFFSFCLFVVSLCCIAVEFRRIKLNIRISDCFRMCSGKEFQIARPAVVTGQLLVSEPHAGNSLCLFYN